MQFSLQAQTSKLHPQNQTTGSWAQQCLASSTLKGKADKGAAGRDAEANCQCEPPQTVQNCWVRRLPAQYQLADFWEDCNADPTSQCLNLNLTL